MHGQINVERQTKVLHDLGYIDALKGELTCSMQRVKVAQH
jgi:hypothetical protein